MLPGVAQVRSSNCISMPLTCVLHSFDFQFGACLWTPIHFFCSQHCMVCLPKANNSRTLFLVLGVWLLIFVRYLLLVSPKVIPGRLYILYFDRIPKMSSKLDETAIYVFVNLAIDVRINKVMEKQEETPVFFYRSMSSGNTELTVVICCPCAEDPMAFTSHIPKNIIFLMNGQIIALFSLITFNCSPFLKASWHPQSFIIWPHCPFPALSLPITLYLP